MNRFVIAKNMNTVPSVVLSARARLRSSVILLAAMGLCLGLSAFAIPSAHAQTQTFGSVNLQQVVQESKARQQVMAELGQLLNGFKTVMSQLVDAKAFYLSEAETKELAGLYEKKMPTPAEQKRRGELEGKANSVATEKTKLENTANPTPENTKRFNEITAMEQRANKIIGDIESGYQTRLNQREIELMNKTLADIKSIVAKVAQEKKLTLVFDSNAVVYTANDITADVLKQVNK